MGAAIKRLPGSIDVAYDAQEDIFTVRFVSSRTRLEDIFGAVYGAGRREGREYLPQVVS